MATTETRYEEAERFRGFSPASLSPQDLYSNLNFFGDGNGGGDGMTASCDARPMDTANGDGQEENARTNSSSTTGGDAMTCQDEEFEEMMDAEKEGSNETESRDVSWNVKISKNWQRQMRRKARNRKNKKSDDHQSIGDKFSGSLSRFFGKASNRLSLPNLTNLSIFKSDTGDGDANEIDGDHHAVACSDNDDDRDDGLWSDTEFDVVCEENLYANINDILLPGGRGGDLAGGKAETEMPWSNDAGGRDGGATTTRHEAQHNTRVISHRQQRTARSHEISAVAAAAAALHKTVDKDATVPVSGAGSRNNIRRKPPIAARPAKQSVELAASLAQRRTCPPGTLDVTPIDVDQRPSSTGARADVENSPPPADSRMSVSSDTETWSDSATSGFSSAGSDVNKSTATGDENATVTMTLGRNAKGQKPAVKPKPLLNDELITMTLNRRPMRAIPSNSNQPSPCHSPTTSPTTPPLPQPRPASHPASTQVLNQPSAAAAADDSSASDVTMTRKSESEVTDDECYEIPEPEAKASYATKPLPQPAAGKKNMVRRAFKWYQSQSAENIVRATAVPKPPVAVPAESKPKTASPVSKGATPAAAGRVGGHAMMPELTQSALQRAVGDLKPKTSRTKDGETSPSAVPKPPVVAVKVSKTDPVIVDHSPVATPLALTLPQLETQSWYFGSTDKFVCEQKVRSVGQDGAFVVRRRQVDNDGSPYALTLSFDRQIYHMLIRRRDSGKYSLGTERPDQHVFNSVVELVCFYGNNAIHLTIDKDSGAVLGKVQLSASPSK